MTKIYAFINTNAIPRSIAGVLKRIKTGFANEFFSGVANAASNNQKGKEKMRESVTPYKYSFRLGLLEASLK